MSNVPDTNRTPVGDVKTKDKLVNSFLQKTKKSNDKVAEIGINYKDSFGNIRQQRISSDGEVTSDKITQESPEFQQKVLNSMVEKTGSRQGKSLFIKAEDWNRIFGKKSSE